MLILTRKESERLIVTCPDGAEIIVQVCQILPHRIRLGIIAPKQYGVDREEVFISKKREVE